MELEVVINSTSPSEKYDLTWEIDNFPDREKFVQTPFFTPSKIVPVKFFLEVRKAFAIGYGAVHRGFCIFLYRCDMDNIPRNLRIVPSVQFKNENGFFSSLTGGPKSASRLYVWNTKTIDLGRVIPYKEKSLVLKFNCELFGHMDQSISSEDLQKSCILKENNLLSGFNSCYRSRAFSDLEIHIDEDIFNVHRLVLAIRSPIFKVMLENNWKESQSSSIHIQDVEPNTFKDFLDYLYTGQINDRSYVSAKSLYLLSDRYAVMDLMAECREIFAAHFATDFLFDLMELAYFHNDDILKHKITLYFNHNFEDFSLKPEWKAIIKQYPEFASEILRAVPLSNSTTIRHKHSRKRWLRYYSYQ